MINREIIYERNLMGSYMKIPQSLQETFDEKLMLQKKLPGLLPVERCYVNGEGQYWYNISGKQSLDVFCKMKSIKTEFVEQLILSICNQIEIMEWNLYDINCLMLDPELIFITNTNGEIIFTMYPMTHANLSEEFQQLMEYLLGKVDHSDVTSVHFVYSVYEKTTREGFSIMDIRDAIVEDKKNKIKISNHESLEINHTEESHDVFQETAEELEENESILKKKLNQIHQNIMSVLTDVQAKFFKVVAQKEEEKDSEEFVFNISYSEEVDEGKSMVHPTVCLSQYSKSPRGMLCYEGNEQFEDISLGKTKLCVGKGEDADIWIGKETISRFHARIDFEDGGYYIEDLNSTNGTFINEKALSYRERKILKENDVVRFADVTYRFV